MNGWHVSGGHHGPDHVAPMNPVGPAPKTGGTEGFSDPQPETSGTVEYAIRYADPEDGTTITEPIGAGSVKGYQRQDWCVVISRTCTEWIEVKS